MAEVTVNRLGEAAQLDNEYQSNHHYMQPSLYEPTPHLSNTAAMVRAYGLVFGVFWAGAVLFGWLLKSISCWGQTWSLSLDCVLTSWFTRLALYAPLVAFVSACLVYLWRTVLLSQVQAWRGRITRDRYSNPVDARRVAQPDWNAAAYFASAQQAEITMAPFKQLPAGLDSLSISAPSGKAAAAATDVLVSIEPLAPAVWLDLLNDVNGEPHVLIAGKTNSGKSTLAEVLLARRVARGDDIYIIDPHYQPVNKYGEITWCGLAGVGGDSWGTVKQALAAVRAEYEWRKQTANAGKMPQGGFKPLSIFMDEAFETFKTIPKEWEAFQSIMGSGARKYNMFLVVMTQSHLIKDIGGSTAQRENFSIIGLNEKAKHLIVDDEGYSADEKRVLLEALRGQQWTAAMSYRAEIKLLDRTGLKEMRPKYLKDVSLWKPTMDALPTVLGGKDTTERDNLARVLFAQGAKFQPVAQLLRKRGHSIDNNRLSEIYREVHGAK